MDILILGDELIGSEFVVEGLKRCSGSRQLVQSVAIDYLRGFNDLLGVGSGASAILTLGNFNEIEVLAREATARCRKNMIRNQKNAGTLKAQETLIGLTFNGVKKDSNGAPIVELIIESASGESTTIQV